MSAPNIGFITFFFTPATFFSKIVMWKARPTIRVFATLFHHSIKKLKIKSKIIIYKYMDYIF